jgi:hypothetical protein
MRSSGFVPRLCAHPLTTQAISNVNVMHLSHVDQKRDFHVRAVHVPHDVDGFRQLVKVVESIIACTERATESVQNVLEARSFNDCCSEKRLIDLIFEIPEKVTANVVGVWLQNSLHARRLHHFQG